MFYNWNKKLKMELFVLLLTASISILTIISFGNMQIMLYFAFIVLCLLIVNHWISPLSKIVFFIKANKHLQILNINLECPQILQKVIRLITNDTLVALKENEDIARCNINRKVSEHWFYPGT